MPLMSRTMPHSKAFAQIRARLALPALLILAACGAPSAGPPPLEGARIGAPFTLTDQTGAKRSWADFDGRYRLVYFGYSFCPDVCPVDLQNLMAGLKAFEKSDPERAGRIAPIFITLDPERDTPRVVGEYVRAFHSRLTGLTGTPAEIAAVAKAFAVYYAKEPGATAGSYLVSHAQLPYLMGPKGEPIALMPVDDPKTETNEAAPETVAAELGRWVT